MDDFIRTDRGRVQFDDRRVIIVVNGIILCLTLPYVFGDYTVVFDLDMDGSKGRSDYINVLSCIKDMTPEIARRISIDDQRWMVNFFVECMDFIQHFWHVTDRPYINEAIADYQAAVNHMIQSPYHYGQSKWASQQMVEKFIKSFLRLKKVPIPRNHDLYKLAALAVANGLDTIEQQLLRDLACKADVRYGDVSVSGSEAVRAHHASLRACSSLLLQIQKA
jgi:HEPN domain-containing protein